jgi:hypothetical protein
MDYAFFTGSVINDVPRFGVEKLLVASSGGIARIGATFRHDFFNLLLGKIQYREQNKLVRKQFSYLLPFQRYNHLYNHSGKIILP